MTRQPVILMADDDDDDCFLARNAFEVSEAPGVFLCVEDGLELMDYLWSCESEAGTCASLPALILLDLNMPKKNGREVLSDIQSIPAFQSTPIVVLTTTRDERDISQICKMGAKAFITKPTEFDQWVKMMQALAQDWLGGNS